MPGLTRCADRAGSAMSWANPTAPILTAVPWTPFPRRRSGAMSKPLNPCIRVADSDAVSDLEDWLASDDADAGPPARGRTKRLIALASDLTPAQALFLHRAGRTSVGALRPTSVSQNIGLLSAESAGSTVQDVVDGLIRSLGRRAPARKPKR
jgi:hypothetical protein